jgi:hypothetical protein
MGSAAGAEEEQAPLGMAVMKQDVSFSDKGRAAFPAPEPRQVLSCARITDQGYMVLCQDAEGNPRMACLPLRDEWGHIAARTWLYEPSLEANTIMVQIPLALEPGSFVLARGERYPVLATNETAYTVRYTFEYYCRTVDIARASADVKPIEKDPAKIQESNLDTALVQHRDNAEGLRKRLQSFEESNARVLGLLKQLNETELEIDRLRADVVKAQTIRQALMEYQPETKALRETQAEQVEKTTRLQGKFSATRLLSQLDADALKNVQAQVQNAELEVERAKTQAMKSRSELSAVIAFQTDAAVEKDKEALKEELNQAGQELAAKSRQQQLVQSSRDLLQILRLEIEQILAENKQLTESVDRIAKEIEILRKGGELKPPPKDAPPVK